VTRTSRRAFFGLTGAAVAGTAIAGVQLVRESSASTASLDLATGGSAPLGGPSTPAYKTLEPFRDPLRIPPVLRPSGDGVTQIRLVGAEIRLHSQLPATPMWTYEGHYPGPTIEVQQNYKIRIAWQNQLQGTTPVRAVYAPPAGPFPGLLNANKPGRDGQPLRPEIAALTPWITTHLHGGHQHAFADGMADCGVIPGNAQLAEYGNDGSPAHLFYHDHAMPITAINFMSGLMGHYIIKDPRADRLGLP
jgi:FtsP/CotA-like multicopper oxidase with cupredoxin domain